VWLGSRIPSRSGIATSRALHSGEVEQAEAQARERLRAKPSDPAALLTLQRALHAQGRFAEAADAARQRAAHAGRGRKARQSAAEAKAWELLCAVESGQVDLGRVEDEISSALQQSQRLASTGTTLAGTHALHHLVHGRLAEAVDHAREALVWDQDRRTRADTLVTLSEALAGLGESAEAADALAEARALWPDNPRLAGVRSNLADMNVPT
jgi:tetratricopeptide (TPR) repeat protein